MKRLRRAIAAMTMSLVFLFSTGPMVHVRADGPQGTQETKSGSPSSSSGTLSDQELAYLLWLIIMWLIFGGM